MFVLIIDDKDYIRDLTADMIETMGLAAKTFGTPDEFISFAKENPVAGAVVDIEIGPWRGQDVVSRLWKEVDPYAKVVLFSGSLRPVKEVDGREVPFLRKPFSPEDMREKLIEAKILKE